MAEEKYPKHKKEYPLSHFGAEPDDLVEDNVGTPSSGIRTALYTYGPVAAIPFIFAANVFRYFSVKKAANELITEDPVFDKIAGGSGAFANGCLSSFGLYSGISMVKEGGLSKDPTFWGFAVATAGSDVFTGIILTENPITKSSALWAKGFTYGSALTVFSCSTLLNLTAVRKMDSLLFYKTKEDVIGAQEALSLSYYLIGRDATKLRELTFKIAQALGLNMNGYLPGATYNAIQTKEDKKLIQSLGIDPDSDYTVEKIYFDIAKAFSRLDEEGRKKFMECLREDYDFSIRSTRHYVLWFMKQLAIAQAVPAAIELFYGPYDLITSHMGKSIPALTFASVTGSAVIPVKASVYYNLLQALYFKAYHIDHTLRNIYFVEEGNLLKMAMIIMAFAAISGLLMLSGLSFYFAAQMFFQFLWGFTDDHSSDGIPAPVLLAGLGIGLGWWGIATASQVNYSASLTRGEEVGKPYLSQGYNPLSRFFDATGKELDAKMPEETLTWRLCGSAENTSSAQNGDEESFPVVDINDDEEAIILGSSSRPRSNYNSFSSSSNFFYSGQDSSHSGSYMQRLRRYFNF